VTAPLRIGTRGSQLALWQARTVAGLIESRGRAVDLIVITTSGDRLQEASLAEVGGKRLFVKEIEDALLRGDVELAVHSAKDMPALLPAGLAVAAALPREDPRDALVLPHGAAAADLAAAAAAIGDSPTIGTSSVRRIAQLSTLLPRARFTPIRGNVDTRLRKLDQGGFDALVLASAGMKRLGFGGRISAPIPPADCVPAPGQGIVAIEIRADDEATRRALQPLDDPDAAASLEAERALVAALGGGCQLPLGAIALHEDGELELHGVVASLDGRRSLRRHARGPRSNPAQLGARVAAELADAGAAAILDEVRSAPGRSREVIDNGEC
jgi:hydroxymethylbilane synthase